MFLPFTEPEVRSSRDLLNSTRSKIYSNEKHIVQCSLEYLSGETTLLVFQQTANSLEKEIVELRILEAEQKGSYEITREAARISGFPSRHKFIYNFGIALILCALFYELLISLRKYGGTKRFQKNFKAITYGTIVGFFLSWIFYPENDLEPWMYKIVLTLLGIAVSVTAFLVALSHENRIRKLEDSFLDFIIELRKVHIKKLLLHALKPNLYRESKKEALEEIEKDTELIEERLREKAKEIID
ncbi:hypothetical protein DX873_15810 [Flagellimonas nanhaiensis]|uniref:Uncharacterized protein n=1 Tax=Flagellimonas nanhaiensis TaxID=2292706 RepID=A0A371JMY3_9FLAO|nr:hypothetical protein DX873_15810 [Allomuricauda nanhaiensis]